MADAPKSARAVEQLLKAMGVVDYEPRVVQQLLELMHRFSSSVLLAADLYSKHAGKAAIDVHDLRLAVRSERDLHGGLRLPPRQAMADLALSRNKLPLPLIPDRHCLHLPPVEHQLTRDNYDVQPTAAASSSAAASASSSSSSAAATVIPLGEAQGNRNKRAAPASQRIAVELQSPEKRLKAAEAAAAAAMPSSLAPAPLAPAPLAPAPLAPAPLASAPQAPQSQQQQYQPPQQQYQPPQQQYQPPPQP